MDFTSPKISQSNGADGANGSSTIKDEPVDQLLDEPLDRSSSGSRKFT